MKDKNIIFLLFLMLFCSISQEAKAAPSQRQTQNIYTQKKTDDKPKSIWDDDSAANPYFKMSKSEKQKRKAAAEAEAQKQKANNTYKHPVYTGPSKKEIAENAVKTAEQNFMTLFSLDEYDLKFDRISYNVSGDALTVTNMSYIPKENSLRSDLKTYLMKADQVVLRNFNIGEIENKPILNNGEMLVRKLELPVWNAKGVKKGKVEIAQLRMKGDVPSYLKSKGEGKFDAIEVRNLRSEAIINETILNNIVRSRVLSASSAFFYEVDLQKKIADSLKRQELDGLEFTSAVVNGKSLPSMEEVSSVMTSYSARVLNTDLVLGARLEAKKPRPDPVPDLDLLRKNVAENKAAVAAAEKELKPE